MRKPISYLVALALAGGLLVASSAPAAAVNGRIAFAGGRLASGGAGLGEIWTVGPDGTGAINLSNTPDDAEADPSWNAAGTRIAFAKQEANSETFDLFTMKSDGKNVRKVKMSGAANNRQPDYSPSDQIAFVRSLRPAGTSHIHVVNEDGGGLAQLTETPAPGYDAAPAWSPSGTQIAFVSDRSGSPQLYLMDPSGATETQLTFDPCFASNPSWNPDGSGVVYERICPGQSSDIYAVSATPPATPAPLVADPANDHQPVFAPDGDQILFTRVQPDGNKDLFTVPVIGGAATPLASNTPEADMSADWGTGVAAREVGAVAGRQVELTAASERRDADPADVRAPRKKKKRDRRPRRLKVAPGVRYKRFRRENSDVYLLKVNPDLAATIDVSLSNDRLAGHERTSRMARRNKAVAAINGDFGMPSGRPSHTFAEDGDLKQLSFAVAWNFAISQDEKTTFFARPKEVVTAEEDDVWRVERWNFGTEPGANDVAAYTPASGGLLAPPGNACSAKLSPVAGPRWAPGMTGVETSYRVDAVGCSSTAMAVNGGLVLAAQPGSDGAILLTSLTVGEEVDLGWSLGWNGVAETVGGTPLLVQDSNVVAEDCPQSICRRNPRTAIGVTSTGRILMVVIDGRRNDSVGVTMVELAQIMRSLHATFALNLDGGGSSTMVVKRKVMNKPSDGNERKVSSAVLVLRGPDAKESIGAAQQRAPVRAAGGRSSRAARAALLDPGSTGGLLEAMAAGSFGPRERLPAELRRALRMFESSR